MIALLLGKSGSRRAHDEVTRKHPRSMGLDHVAKRSSRRRRERQLRQWLPSAFMATIRHEPPRTLESLVLASVPLSSAARSARRLGRLPGLSP